MRKEERAEIVALLREELREFVAWTMEELGGDYYLEGPEHPLSSWDDTAEGRILRRFESGRTRLWERDWYSFFDHPRHPSIYKVMEAEDLEILHYPEAFYCDHYKVQDEIEGMSEDEIQENKRFEQAFGVLLASQTCGWMYRLDFCDVCGLIEIWSMEYNQDEIAFYADMG